MQRPAPIQRTPSASAVPLPLLRFARRIRGMVPDSGDLSASISATPASVPVTASTVANGPYGFLNPIIIPLIAAIKRLDLSTDVRKTLTKLSKHHYTVYNTTPFVLMGICALFSLYIMESNLLKVLIPLAYTVACLLPVTSQFVWPATYIFAWLITFFCARYIPSEWRPEIHVVLLPTLESVLYGANISDILTRFTHPVLDVIAWLPYGLGHFVIPFVVAAFLWVFAPKGAVQFFAKAFGALNLSGVVCQLVFPCAAPWYEIIHGLTPANYSMPGSPGGLMRIDRIFHGSGYTNAFGSAPLVFGAFPSLHSGCATMSALFLTHFFPKYRFFYWTYVGTLYWATMYLTHHYLIDVVAGGSLALGWWFYTMPKEFKDLEAGIDWTQREASNKAGTAGDGSSLRPAPLRRRGNSVGVTARDFELQDQAGEPGGPPVTNGGFLSIDPDRVGGPVANGGLPPNSATASTTSTPAMSVEIRTPVDGNSETFPPSPVDYNLMARPEQTRPGRVPPNRKRSVTWGEATKGKDQKEPEDEEGKR